MNGFVTRTGSDGLGWLIDPFERRVHVYRPGAAVQVLDDPDGVDGAPVLPGFRLDLGRIR